jgi:hypothetical protein
MWGVKPRTISFVHKKIGVIHSVARGFMPAG